MKEMEALLKKTCDQLLEAHKIYQHQVAKYKELMMTCQEKDEKIFKLENSLEQSIETASEYRSFVDGVKEEILHYRKKCKCLVNNGKEEVKDQEIQRLVQTLKKKDELLDQMQHEQHSLKEKVKELANDLMQQDLVYRNTVSTLETERAAATRLTAENQALSSKLVEFQQVTDYMSTKLQALETDLSIQTSTVIDLSEELQKAKALLRDGEEERTQQSRTISSLKLEVGELQQKNIKAIMTTLHEKSRKIEALETELSRTRKEMEKVLEELRQDRCTALREQAQEEVLKLQKQMCDDQDQIKTLRADLLQKEYNISYLQSEMRQANTRIAVLQKEVQTLAEALWEHRTKRVDAEGERDRALSALWNQEQTIAQLKTEQVGSQQTLRKYWETCQLLQEKDKLIHELRFTLAEKERARVEQEKCVDALQKDIRSLTESNGRPLHFFEHTDC
ncbi:uncharacterized protein LOC143489286 [Brachyhypopomus gauderio]|uniref:uncharacterized protein LOC143489286 n=1 Tax=Brachyhypopomus gauderio TaxID=698409 RepID=UPI0040418B17